MAQVIDAITLKGRLDSREELVLVNVLPEEAFTAAHLPGSVNACVYEVVFPETIQSLVPDKGRSVVVYGQGKRFQASQRAAERLDQLGYTQVFDFRGGVDEWKAARFPVEGDGRMPQPEFRDGTFPVDAAQSLVAWEGSNLSTRHCGTIAIKSGSLTMEDRKPVSAECVVDMNAIVCDDIFDRVMNATLIAHLKSDDFFDAEKYPEGRFSLISFEPIDGAHPGEANAKVKGNLTLRGVTQPIEFTAVAGVNASRYVLQALLEIDRTLWNVRYGSGKIFEWLEKHLVNDVIILRLKIVVPFR